VSLARNVCTCTGCVTKCSVYIYTNAAYTFFEKEREKERERGGKSACAMAESEHAPTRKRVHK